VLAGAAAVGDEIAFADVVFAATGHRVVPLDAAGATGAAVVTAVSEAAAAVARAMNEAGAPVRGLRRINEASRHFEDALARQLDAHPDFACAAAADAGGRPQRPGYPDLKLVHLPTGTVAYLDPKLFESATRESTLRTFYYEPPTGTGGSNKITTDAHHLVVGFEHDGRDGAWTFTSWHVVDLSGLAVRLKAEFQADNRGLYGGQQVLSSGKP
jgi:hypothetical protein